MEVQTHENITYQFRFIKTIYEIYKNSNHSL